MRAFKTKKKSSFYHRIYQITRQIPPGKVTTYREIAHALGSRASRAVGQALAKSPGMPEVPCHRVVRSDGTIGGFGGQTRGPKIALKKKLLEKEGVYFTQKRSKISEFYCFFTTHDRKR